MGSKWITIPTCLRKNGPAFKLTIVQYVIVAILLVLLSGLWRLQVIGAQNYRVLAEQNRIRKVPILAPRGKLFDREGRLIVDNYPSVSCFLIREPGRDLRADFPAHIARFAHDSGPAGEHAGGITRWLPSISPFR